MINAEKAYRKMIYSSNAPIGFMVDYGDAYVFGFKSNNRKSPETTYKAVMKDDGSITNFIVDDFDEFFEAVDKRSVDISKFNRSESGSIKHSLFSGKNFRIR